LPSNLIVDNGSNVLIKWESNPSSLIDSDGTIHAPTFSQGDANVKLIATIGVPSSDNPSEFDVAFATVNKEFILTIPKLDMTDKEAVISDANEIANMFSEKTFTSDLVIPNSGSHGTIISILYTYSFTNGEKDENNIFIDTDGKITRPNYLEGDKQVNIKFLIKKGEEIMKLELSVYLIKLPMTDTEAIILAKPTLDLGDTSNRTTPLALSTSLEYGVEVSWSSPNNDDNLINLSTGAITQPTYTQGVKTVTLIATLTKGSASPVTKEFTIIIPTLAITSNEAISLEYEDLTLGDTSNITESITLPVVGLHGTKINWSSDNTYIFSNEGVVHRPEDNDYTVKLTATISKEGGIDKIKIFEIVVKKKEQNECDALSQALGYCS